MVIVEYAKSGAARCVTCSGKIAYETIRYGTSKTIDEGFWTTEWHHDRCFWTRRARRFFVRGKGRGKPNGHLISIDQFTGRWNLTQAEQDDLAKKVLEVNQKWGTEAALQKAGIPILRKIPEQDEKGKKRSRETDEEDQGENEEQGVNESKGDEENPEEDLTVNESKPEADLSVAQRKESAEENTKIEVKTEESISTRVRNRKRRKN